MNIKKPRAINYLEDLVNPGKFPHQPTSDQKWPRHHYHLDYVVLNDAKIVKEKKSISSLDTVVQLTGKLL
jgi:hypothetical protein